nr:tripartite motif-containing protein 3-like [Crassostrea gigas]
MDPRSSAQDVHRCDLCENALVHSYCDFCHVNLCKPCIGDHISDGYHKHKIVLFKERRSTLIYPKCGTHLHKNCEFQCKDCDYTLVCSSCMASEIHEGHRFVEVTYEYQTKKEIIEKDSEELEKNICPKYEEIAHDLENQLANLDGGYEKITSEISKQGEEWHREIEIIINQMKSEINEIKMKHKYILQKHLDEINEIESLMKKSLLNLKELAKSTEVSSTIEYSSKIREFSKLPPKLQVLLPTFIPNPKDRGKLCSMFGQFTTLFTATVENPLSLNQPNISVRELLDKPELVAKIQTGYTNLRSVACLNDEQIWTSGLTNDIKCLNIRGSLVQAIHTKSGKCPNDISVDSDGDILYSDGTTQTVNKVKNGRTHEIIRLQGWKPNNLCVSSNGDLLVTMRKDDYSESKVVRYSGSTEKQTIQFDDKGKPLYSGNYKIKYITENRNHDICVADFEAGLVVVVNEDGKLRWKYTAHPLMTKNNPFKPYGIATDSQCRILTADSDNHCIHILDHNGQFLRYIDNCDLKDPFGLFVDNNDILIVCDFGEGDFKKIKYST